MKIRPNAKCSCGSGKQYKQCCGAVSVTEKGDNKRRISFYIVGPQKTCNGIFHYLDLTEADVQPEFKVGVKGVYTGNKINYNRAKKNQDVFNKEQKQQIIKRNISVFEKFYSEELV